MSLFKLFINLSCSVLLLLPISGCSTSDHTRHHNESNKVVAPSMQHATPVVDRQNPSPTPIKNETHRRYGVKGATLAYVPVNDKISRYRAKGKRYTTLNRLASRQFSQQGVASYYGGTFHGRKTASGEIFNQHAYTAAHKTLALGSYALVTNLRNGRQVIVRINDRGPFSQGRVIDLSVAAAREIGMYHAGVTQVKIEAIHVDKQGYLMGKGVESLQQVAKRKKLPLLIKGEGRQRAIKAK